MGEGTQGIAMEVAKSIEEDTEKMCFMCESRKAEFCIKDNPQDCYCKQCAQDAFGDTSYLEKL